MNMIRELLSGQDEVIKLVNTASQAGYGVIELVWKTFGPSNKMVTGFQVPAEDNGAPQRSLNPMNVSVVTDIRLVRGNTSFYVASDGRRWGYVVDTDFNREKLATNLAVGWYTVVDKKIREEIIELAASLGKPTEKIPREMFPAKKTVKEEALVKALDKAETDRVMLEMKIKKLEESIAEDAKRKLEREAKPLAGVKLPKTEEIKI